MASSPLLSGSTGTGFCLDEGVTTEILLDASSHAEFRLIVNGERLRSAPTCEALFRAMVPENSLVRVTACQVSRLPAGYGYGISGASALSMGLALNKALQLGLTTGRVGQLAHVAEVESLTGLGDIAAQLLGGFELRSRPGAPGVGEVRSLDFNGNYLAVTSPVSSFPTSTMITREDYVNRINTFGSEAMASFASSPSPESLMENSRKFWLRIGIMNEAVKEVLSSFERAGVKNPSAKKGVVFGLVPKDETWGIVESILPGYHLPDPCPELPHVIKDRRSGLMLIISKIAERGAFCWE
jgi:pantoate kinase